jgi:hypothetical protein
MSSAAKKMTFTPHHSPTIVNATKHTIVVFQARGTLYNKQVLLPGEAVSMTRKETGGRWFLRYKVHALIGDESALPTGKDSVKNLVKATAIPAAFIAGCFATAITAGMLAGPSLALAPLVSGMVVNGVVIDSAALAAGGIMASRAQVVTDLLMKQHSDKFMAQTDRLKPGQRFLVVKGGLSDGPIVIENLSKHKFQKLAIMAWKGPMDSKQNKIRYYFPSKDKPEEEQRDDETPQIEQERLTR